MAFANAHSFVKNDSVNITYSLIIIPIETLFLDNISDTATLKIDKRTLGSYLIPILTKLDLIRSSTRTFCSS